MLLRDRALALLSQRDYSVQGLFQRLYPRYSADREAVHSLLSELVAQGWLSDRRFMESLLRSKRGHYGPARMVMLARQAGLSSDLCEELASSLVVDEAEVLRTVWSKKFRQYPQTPQEKAKQFRYLKYRGFSDAAILRFLQGQA